MTEGGEMDPKIILETLMVAMIEGDQAKVRENARAALDVHLDPLRAVEEGLSKGMAIVGERFEEGEAFLPELLTAAETFSSAMEILKPAIDAQKRQLGRPGTVVIGTVRGDVHNIGKNIVSTVLETQGFEVVDLGVDNSPLKFIEEAEKVKADVIALSSLMTTTMPGQKEVIETLKEMKLRDRYFVIVGGGPVTQKWADQIGADGYGKGSLQAVELVKKMVSGKSV
jgi:corrinoid protein of di/trimethylamine methyltransferase